MFDRRAHLLETLRDLARIADRRQVEQRSEKKSADSLQRPMLPIEAAGSFLYSYLALRYHYPELLSRIDYRPLEALLLLVQDAEYPLAALKPIKWLYADVKTHPRWKKIRALAKQGLLVAQALPAIPKVRPLKNFSIPIIHSHRRAAHDSSRAAETKDDERGVSKEHPTWWDVRIDLLLALSKFGLVGPDDLSRMNAHFYLVDDRWYDEPYHIVELYKSSVLTLNWLRDMTSTLQKHPGWGVIVPVNGRNSLRLFGNRIEVSGKDFRPCKEPSSLLRTLKRLVAAKTAAR